MTPNDLIHRYFELAPSADRDAYFALFAADAVVEDEGNRYHGVEAIRAWRGEVPTVTYRVVDVTDTGEPGGRLAHAEVAGDFPGSPVTLAFHFVFTDDGLIGSLAITV